MLQRLRELVSEIESLLNSPSGGWSARGVIDLRRMIYPLSYDTKLISKVIELLILPILMKFAAQHRYQIKIAPEQNYYPDVTFIDEAGCKFAIDIRNILDTLCWESSIRVQTFLKKILSQDPYTLWKLFDLMRVDTRTTITSGLLSKQSNWSHVCCNSRVDMPSRCG